MKKYFIAVGGCCNFAALLSIITACAPIGGTCNYVQSNERVRVVAVANAVQLSSLSGEAFEVMFPRFAHPPQVGQFYDIVVERQTSGSCTPVVVTRISEAK
jgi:hypothetical protein